MTEFGDTEVGTCGAQARCGAGFDHECRYPLNHDGPHQSRWYSRNGWRVGIDWNVTDAHGNAIGTWVKGGGRA